MSRGFIFPPVDNGLDYLHSVIDHLGGQPTERDLKYAVLHLQAATEVLLKVRLIREHWSLVFKNPDKATHAAYISGDFVSVGMEEALMRLKGIAGVDLPDRTKHSFTRLAKERNKLQHFGLEAQGSEAIDSLVGEVFDALLVFITRHLLPGAASDEEGVFDETLTIIRGEIDRITTLITARLTRITPELDAKAGQVIQCPGCLRYALPLEADLHCLFCERRWEPGPAALEYASEVLGFTWRDIARGANEPVVACPECDLDALVWGVTVRQDQDYELWACFNCGIFSERNAIDSCPRCGTPRWSGEDDMTVCSSCFSHVTQVD